MKTNLIKNSLISLLFLVGTPPIVRAQDEAPNLVKNSSFEEMNATTQLPINWSYGLRGNKEAQNIEFKISDQGQEGRCAVEIVATPTKDAGTVLLADWSQMVPVRPLTKYYFSVYCQADVTKGWPIGVMEERMSDRRPPEYGSNREVDHKAQIQEERLLQKGEYQLWECKFETGPETSFVNISLRFQAPVDGAVRFDNATLIELP